MHRGTGPEIGGGEKPSADARRSAPVLLEHLSDSDLPQMKSLSGERKQHAFA
jgi:hypothetical protein